MAHVEQQLISRIVRSGEFPKVVEWGITEDDFHTTEARGYFTILKGFYSASESRGSIPGPHAWTEAVPGFDLCDDPSMTLDGLCSAVRKHRIVKDIEAAILRAHDTLYEDPLATVGALHREVGVIQSLGYKTVDVQLSSAMDEQVQRYEMAMHGIGLGAVTWPWAPLNDVTAGIQDDDYVILYGRPKSMKSFVLAKMAAHGYEEGKHVLVYTKEMPAWQLFRRISACIGRLPYDELRLGKLNETDKQVFYNLRTEVQEQAERTGGKHNITVLSGRDAPTGMDNVSWLRTKVSKYKPDIVFIDGLYLMSPDGKAGKDHERVMSISRATRQMVLDTKIPVVATMQATRAAAKHESAELDEIAYSDAIGQDATCAMRVINEKTGPTIALVMAGSREFKLHGMRIWGLPCANFSFKEEMTERDIEKAKKEDTKPEEEEKAGAQVKRTPITDKNRAKMEKELKQRLDRE